MIRPVSIFILVFPLLSACQPQQDIKIRAVGEGFYWHFTYAGQDGILDTQDDIHQPKILYLPKGRSSKIQVTSKDYVYMFRSAKLGINELATPGLAFTVEFTATQRGDFSLEIDPLCGANFLHDHEYMGMLSVISTGEFNQWLGNRDTHI